MTVDADVAKRAFIQVLSDGGVLLSEMKDWKCAVKGNAVTLNGTLTKNGLRRVLSLVDSPTSSQSASAQESKSESTGTSTGTSTDPETQMAEATLQHFKKVNDMFDDLKGDMRDAANLAVTAMFFDRYAKRIERLPILDVDPVMLDHSSYVAASLRAAAGAVRTMGIRGGARQSQIDYTDVQYNYAYGYRSGWYGNTAVAVPVGGVGATKAVDAERRKVRSEERGIAATSVHQIRDEVIATTTQVRRAMTEKYRIEF